MRRTELVTTGELRDAADIPIHLLADEHERAVAGFQLSPAPSGEDGDDDVRHLGEVRHQLAGSDPDLVGVPYQDASGTGYGPLIRQPILIFSATAGEIKRTHRLALERGVRLFIYTAALFATGHDAENRAAVAAVERDALDLVGLAFRAEKRIADKLVKGLRLHP